MSFRPELSLRADQRLTLAPRMLQGIEFLQIATAELLGRVEQELQRNETLELAPTDARVDAEIRSLAPAAAERSDPDSPDPQAFGPPDARRRAAPGGEDVKGRLLAQVPSAGVDPISELRMQLAWREVSADLADQVLRLAEALDERGLLDATDAELAEIAGVADAAEPLSVLQSLEPKGLGARSGVEAMLLQIDPEDPDRPDLERMLTDHLDALARNRIPDVARSLGLEPTDVEELIQKAARLDPRPGARFFEQVAEQIRPELRVYFDENGNLRVELEDGSLPELAIDSHYEGLVRSAELDKSTRRYLKGKLAAARDLIDALEQRRVTLLRVARAIFEHQRDVVRDGMRSIRPLRMSEIAETLELNTSTVSRAIAGKWVRTPHGVVSLRDFFDGARGQAAADTVSGSGRGAVKARVQEVIAAEDPSTPLSDDEVVTRLAAAGLKVARRTVTKYRKELGIPASWRRRKYGS